MLYILTYMVCNKYICAVCGMYYTLFLKKDATFVHRYLRIVPVDG